MKTGKILLMVMLIVGFMTLVACGKKAEEKAPAKVKKTEETATPAEQREETQPTKAWTDDDFVEFWAQIAYLSEKYQKDPVKMVEESEKVYKKLGLTSEEWLERYGAWTKEWLEKVQSNPMKYGEEWSKLQKKMQKRLDELRKGK